MPANLEAFYHGAAPLLSAFEHFVAEASVKDIARVDHLCYKCASSGEYEKMRTLFDFESVFVYQSIIAARRISVIKLKQGFETSLGIIKYLELSDQKKDGSQKGRFDHVEIYPTSGTYDELILKVEAQGVKGVKVVRPHHTTYDILLDGGFLIRLEEESLVEKIASQEMK